MELHELRQGVLKELEATAAAERAPEVCTWNPVGFVLLHECYAELVRVLGGPKHRCVSDGRVSQLCNSVTLSLRHVGRFTPPLHFSWAGNSAK